MYWDDNDLLVEPYERKKKRYFCGKKIIKPKKDRKIKCVIVIVDLSETYCAKIYDDGDIEKIFSMNPNIPNKQKAGGQSQRRFERGREQKIIHYFKKINEKMDKIQSDFIIGINFIYRQKLEKYLSAENKQKLIKFVPIEYSGLTGVSQYRNKILKD